MSKIIFENLTTSQMAYLFNGCGNKTFGWLVPDKNFAPACVRHDVDYYIGGGEGARYDADLKFYNHMMVIAKQQYWSWWWRARAYAYYKGVRLFGRSAFNYGPEQTLIDLEEDMRNGN